MTSSTKDRLVDAAADLLDQGGQDAVTLRAVAERVGVSHNAPYKHFRDRNALLAGVAWKDFASLTEAFAAARDGSGSGREALREALKWFVEYAGKHKSRYRLLFSESAISPTDELKQIANGLFAILVEIVARCQKERTLPAEDTVRVAGLLYATVHGAIDLEISGRTTSAKGLSSALDVVDLALELLEG